SGPIPLDALEELHTFYEEFQHKTIALAKKINKPPEALFSQVGYGFPAAAGRNVSIWSVFLAWRAKNGPPKPADVPASEWPKMLAVEYEEFLQRGLEGKPSTPANRRAVMEPLVRWYRSNLLATIARTKQKGQMKRVIGRVLQGFLKMSKEAFELYDLHVFGYIMHLVPDKAGDTYSRSWGSTPAYEQMLLDHKPLINREIHKYESMMTVSQLSLDNVERYIVHDIDDEESRKRDKLRAIFNNQIRQDIGRILFSRGKVSLQDALDWKIQWARWPKQAVEEKLRLINWPVGHALPTELGNDAPRRIEGKLMRHSIRARHEVYPNFAIEGDRSTIDYVAIVSWSNEERDLLEYDDAWGAIPILVDSAGKVLLSAVHSKTLDFNRKSKPASKKKKGKAKEASNDVSDDSDDVDNETESRPSPGPSKSKRKDKGKKRRLEDNESDSDGVDLPQKRARVPSIPSVGSSTDVQKTLAQMQELLKKAGYTFD
ncbi:hypothetical protein H0H92_008820, partial [Tricholoma furcatifolium]